MSGYGQGVIPDDWEGEFCRYAVCWPNSPQWHAVLRGVLTIPAQGRFWDGQTGTIIEAQSVIRQTFDYNLHFEEVIMACGDEGLAQIALAIQMLATSNITTNSGCCDNKGSRGQGQTAPPFSPITPGDPETDPPPDGFEEWEEFNLQKCAIAWDIIEKLELDLGEMAIINIGNLGISGLAAILALAFATPIPFDDIVAIAALLLAVAAEIIITTTLSIVNDNEEVLTCGLFSGTDAQSSRTMFLSEFDILATAGIADPVQRFACETLIRYMVGSAVVNRLYTKDLTRVWNERDCSMCGPAWWSCAIGTVITHTNDTVDILGVDLGDFDYTTAVAYSNEAGLGTLEAEIIEGSWSAPSDIPEFASAYDTDEDMCGVGAGGDWENAESGFQTGPVEARILQHRQNAPVTVRYTRVMP